MGFHPADRMAFVERQPELFRSKPRYPTMIVIFSADTERGRTCLRLWRGLHDRAGSIQPDLPQLSMGMSGDFEIAIEEGQYRDG